MKSYPKGKIDENRAPKGQKTFKGGRNVESEWLRKANPVRQTFEAPKSFNKGR